MFATLAGPLPPSLATEETPVGETRARETRANEEPAAAFVGLAIALQADAGLGLLTDGLAAAETGTDPGADSRTGARRAIVERWRRAAALTDHPVKQCVVGPYTLGRRPGRDAAPEDRAARSRLTLVLAEVLREEIRALDEAGCPVVQVDEDAAVRIGGDPFERELFREAHARLTAGFDRVHLALAVGWGNADAAGPATFFDLPYRSYLFDLVAGPENWRLIVDAPADRGIVCGALDPAGAGSGDLELMIWAARYAASTKGRGMDRVGLAPAHGLETVSSAQARKKLVLLGEAARLATASREELREVLDPRAFDGPGGS